MGTVKEYHRVTGPEEMFGGRGAAGACGEVVEKADGVGFERDGCAA